MKSEMSRLARREVKQVSQAFKKIAARYRSDIAALKRTSAGLTAKVKQLERSVKVSVTHYSTPETKPARFNAKGIVTHRKSLGLSAEDYGLLLGVSGATVYMWEQRVVRPRADKLSSIASVRALGKRDAAAKLAVIKKPASPKKSPSKGKKRTAKK
jgi:DNA-binding transcriptional regulator YiaG